MLLWSCCIFLRDISRSKHIQSSIHEVSHLFAVEKGRKMNHKQLFGINGYKCGDVI